MRSDGGIHRVDRGDEIASRRQKQSLAAGTDSVRAVIAAHLCAGSELVEDFRGFFESPERDQGLDIQGPNEQLVVPSRAPPDRTQPLAVLLQARVSRSRLP